jgi:hypothetical protein
VETLRPLLKAVGEEADKSAGRHVPLLVKIAPDLTDEDIDDVARLAMDLGWTASSPRTPPSAAMGLAPQRTRWRAAVPAACRVLR